MHMTEKHRLESANQLKANNWSVENLKNMWPQACNMVMWHWSADILFSQLSTDHDMDVFIKLNAGSRLPH